MKKLAYLIIALSVLNNLVACQSIQENLIEQTQKTSIQSTLKTDVYPFDTQKDFFPMYDKSTWKYDITDQNKKTIGTITKSIDSNNNESTEVDKKNNYYIISIKKLQTVDTKEKGEFEILRRKGSQLSFGKYDLPLYYPEGSVKTPSKDAYNPYNFRPFIDFSKASKLETIKVKAGTFQCIKTEFTVNMDKYTMWFAKDVGEVKRIKEQSYFNTYTYELSEYTNQVKAFVLKKEVLDMNSLSQNLKDKANLVKKEYLKLNNLPENLFESSNFLGFSAIYVSYDNIKDVFDISYISKSPLGKDNIRLSVSLDKDSNIKSISTLNENNEKSVYKGNFVDKLPTLI